MKIEIGADYTATYQDEKKAEYLFHILHCVESRIWEAGGICRKYYIAVKVGNNICISGHGTLYWFNEEGISLGDWDFQLKRKSRSKHPADIKRGQLWDANDDFGLREPLRREKELEIQNEYKRIEEFEKQEISQTGLGRLCIQCTHDGKSKTWDTGLMITNRLFSGYSTRKILDYVAARNGSLPPSDAQNLVPTYYE